MTDARELLAMMSPRGVDPIKPPGGKPAITALDVAAALAMGNLSQPQSALLLVKYCGEDSMRYMLWSYWFTAVMKQAKAEKWKVRRRPGRESQLRLLTSYSLQEFLDDLHCEICEGRKTVAVSSSIIECPACEGTGRQYPSQRAIARELQVDESNYRRAWAGRLRWCRYELTVWEVDAIYRLATSL